MHAHARIGSDRPRHQPRRTPGDLRMDEDRLYAIGAGFRQQARDFVIGRLPAVAFDGFLP